MGAIKLLIDSVATEIGEILIVTEAESLCALDFADCESRMMKRLSQRYNNFSLVSTANPLEVCTLIRAYFDGHFASLDSILVKTGGTPFQQRVWSALKTIPVGSVISYQELAHRLGQAKACRAVGLANSLNPIALVLPCHRVIGHDFTLKGYAGGVERKRWLLRHEGVNLSALSKTQADAQGKFRFKQLSLLES